MPETTESHQLVDHFFRHEYGRLVALLAKVFGLRNLDLVEDMVQSALAAALQSWRTRGLPDDPAAWIYRVARNKVIEALRRADTARRLAPALAERQDRRGSDVAVLDDLFLDSEIEDGLLRMIFACGHPTLPAESQIALTLKTLCGFSRLEIARALLTTEENVKKRITRARQRLLDEALALEVPAAGDLPARLETVHAVLYLMFNEGYSATSSDQAIRRDLCGEAARLCHLLCEHPQCGTPTTLALMALMLFHAARLDARLDAAGLMLLLEEQDRSKWDHGLIRTATDYLLRSARGDSVSTYHLEAGIAMYHCKAASFADTDWPLILRQYDLLIRLQRSPVYLLNRAIALAQVEGAEAGINALSEIRSHPQMKDYHLLDATFGELHRKAGRLQEAREHFQAALKKAQAPADRQVLTRRLAMCYE